MDSKDTFLEYRYHFATNGLMIVNKQMIAAQALIFPKEGESWESWVVEFMSKEERKEWEGIKLNAMRTFLLKQWVDTRKLRDKVNP